MPCTILLYFIGHDVIRFFLFRAALLRKCWLQDPLQRPKPSEIVKILIENPELVHACIDVPGTTLLDDSMGNFDATKASARAPEGMGSFDHMSSTATLTQKENDSHMTRKHSVKPEASTTNRHPAMLWRKTSVHF